MKKIVRPSNGNPTEKKQEASLHQIYFPVWKAFIQFYRRKPY